MSAPRNALTVREAEILDLWDGGRTIEQIAEQIGKSRKFVAAILSLYSGAVDAQRVVLDRARCHAYASALIATGKVYA